MKNVHYINAGAGSGKTYILTETMADLFAKEHTDPLRTDPSRVILTTFTELAAAEFKAKAREKLVSKGLLNQAAQMESAVIGTVHSLAFRYIRKYWYLLGLGANIQPMTEEEETLHINESLSNIASDEDIKFFNDYVDKLNIILSQSTRKHYDMWKDDLKALVEQSETFGVEDLADSYTYSSGKLKDYMSDPDFFTQIKAKLQEKEIDVLEDSQYRDLIMEYQKRIYDLGRKWKQNYAEYKRLHNIVSFNDMERLFIDLLSKDEVCSDIRGSIDYVFVDEFQDSNPTQIRIFDMLSELVKKGSYWVGDPKQAIYDFRGCDTELVSKITDYIEEKKNNAVPGFYYESLRQSWRSHNNLVELVNRTFVPVFYNLAPDKVTLNPVRNNDLPAQVPNLIHWNMFLTNPDTNRRITNAETLASSIAGNVFRILNGDDDIKQVKDKITGQLRPIRPNDIALLCYTKKECDMLAQELRNLNIPVAREYTCDTRNREMMLVITILCYIAELKAPDILKAELYSLFKDKEFEYIAANRESVVADGMFTFLDELKANLRDQPVSVVTESVINTLDLYHTVGKWGYSKNRKIRMSACLTAGRVSTLYGFINYISTTNEIKVSKDILSDGVNVLTYHSCKGLEWNVVILCSLGRSSLKPNNFIKKTYIGVNVIRRDRSENDHFYSDFIVRYIPRFLSASNSNLPQSMSEMISGSADYTASLVHERYQMARLLYVGMTRARDYLISTSAKEDNLDWLKELGIESTITKNTPKGTMVQVWGSESPLAYYKKITNDVNEGFVNDEKTNATLKLAQTRPDYQPLYLNPSTLEPDTGQVQVESLGNITDGALISVKSGYGKASDLGTCIHNIFEVFDLHNGTSNAAMATRLICQFGFEKTLVTDQVINNVSALFGYLERTYGTAQEVKRELPFTLAKDGQIIRGEMDLVWKTDRGCILVDYKNYKDQSDYTNPESADYSGHLAPQLALYKAALEKAGQKVIDALVYYPLQGALIRLVL